jgi:phytoene dehydrogenase-like protein
VRKQLQATHYDALVIGSGHNGLIAAAYLAAAGLKVAVLEKNDYLGGATTSQQVFPDYDAWLSRYAYLVSLLPARIVDELGLDFACKRRTIASFTPYHDAAGTARGLLISNIDNNRSRESVIELTGSLRHWQSYQEFLHLESSLAKIAWPSLLMPLRHRQDFTDNLKDELQRDAWRAFVDQPLGVAIERHLENDILRGLVMTDAKIGVLTHPHDESLLQNRCFLYHTIGQGTGEWQVPIGGMRSIVDSLIARCLSLEVEFLTHAAAIDIEVAEKAHTVTYRCQDEESAVSATRVLINAGPRTTARLLDEPWSPKPGDEGSVMKVNILLRRLPRLLANDVTPAEAFTGSFHMNEGYQQMIQSYFSAAAGEVPQPAPAEMYCHTLTDDSILAPSLREQGFHTLTLFGLDMPYRLFAESPQENTQRVLKHYLQSLDLLCQEDFLDCVAQDKVGRHCIEIKNPLDLENEVGLDLGNIFHNQPSWFFTDDPDWVGRWGVETRFPRVYQAGSAAIRGGAVSGIPGRNAAMCIFDELAISHPILA